MRRSSDNYPVFIEVNPDGTQSSVQHDESMKVCEIRIQFNSKPPVMPVIES